MSRFLKRVQKSFSRSPSPTSSTRSSDVSPQNSVDSSLDDKEDVWDLSPKQHKQDKMASEKALCTKYGSCEEYTKMFCASLPMAKRAEFEDFLKYAKVHNILKPSATVEDVQVLCQTFRDNV